MASLSRNASAPTFLAPLGPPDPPPPPLAGGRGAALVTPRRAFPRHLIEIYDIQSMIGRGAFSTVWRAVHRTSGEVRAVKKIDTAETSPRDIAHEIALMRLLRHESVVRCYDVYIEAQCVNIVVDMFPGGDLIDGFNAYRDARGSLPDRQLAHLASQMLAAVAHVHGLQIVHRDIKGENFLCDRANIGDPACRVALADFGTAQRIRSGETLIARAGTPCFWAPEVFTGGYGFLVDVWALGVTAYVLLTGRLPFEGEADVRAPAPPPGRDAASMPLSATSGCRRFINLSLRKDPARRPAAHQLAADPWLHPASPSSGPGLELPTSAADAFTLGLDCLAAVAIGCFSGLTLALDILLSHAQPPRPYRKESKARRSPRGTGAAADADLEKQITDLSLQLTKGEAAGGEELRRTVSAASTDDSPPRAPVPPGAARDAASA